MEWVEITAKTIEEARELAIDKLGADESEVEIKVIEEPKQGLFGRTRGAARLRARVAPRKPRAKSERRDSRKKGGDRAKKAQSAPRKSAVKDNDTKADTRNDRPSRPRRETREKETFPIENVRETVDSFLTGLVGAFGYDAAVEIPEEDDTINANIAGKYGLMVGPKARTLDAIQELTRVVAQRTTPSQVRIRLDVGSYRETRKQELAVFAAEVAETSSTEGVEVVLEPMSSADRKTLHDAFGDLDGVSTRSAGSEPRRRVIVVPDAPSTEDGTESDDEE